jgi:hypothetical protein
MSHEKKIMDRTAEKKRDTSRDSTLNRANNPAGPSQVADLLTLQRILGNRAVQRLLQSSRSPEEEHGTPGDVSATLEARIMAARSGGRAIDSPEREGMESAFGADFRSVRLHTDSEANTLSNTLNARAFTVGRDIFFAEGAYSPQSPGGREILAHELAHVVQQNGPVVRPKLLVSTPGDPYEQDADARAREVMDWDNRSGDAANLNQAADARAFMHGKDIQLSEGRYGPGSSEGRSTMAHELAPVVQQNPITFYRQARKPQPEPAKPAPPQPGTSAAGLYARYDGLVDSIDSAFKGLQLHCQEWQILARNMGNAFAEANQRFEGALKGKEKYENFLNQIFSSVFIVVGVGVIAYVSTIGKLASAMKAMPVLGRLNEKQLATAANVAEDVIQQAYQQAGPGVFKPLGGAEGGGTSVKLPLVYQNNVMNTIDRSHLDLLQDLHSLDFQVKMRKRILAPFIDTAPPGLVSFMKVDYAFAAPLVALRVGMADGFISSCPVPSADMQRVSVELERGMWAHWLPSLERTVTKVRMDLGGPVITEETEYEAWLGGAMEDRLDATGITAESGVGDFGLWTSGYEVSKLVNWARTKYKPVKMVILPGEK